MLEIRPTDMAHGGEAVGRVDGKAHFVAGAIPGELVTAEVVADRGRWARARLIDVLEPSPLRVVPPCPVFGTCGGCTWQFADYELQLDWKRSTVAGQLAHLGGIEDPPVQPTVPAETPYGYRNRMDFAVLDGRPALHRARSDHLVALDECLLLHPTVAELFDQLGDLGGVRKVTLRSGTRTGHRLAVLEGNVPGQANEWEARLVRRRGGSLQAIKGKPWIEEQVAGTVFRIPAGAFFQVNTPAADQLVRLVGEALAVEPNDVLLDGYAGVGLFAATVGSEARAVHAVESGRDAARACRGNLERHVPGRFTVTRARFERLSMPDHRAWTVAVVDPPRSGLEDAGVAVVTGPEPRAIAYVSCDPAALARDARSLAERGYRLVWATPVDMFPQTFHIETVACFVRG